MSVFDLKPSSSVLEARSGKFNLSLNIAKRKNIGYTIISVKLESFSFKLIRNGSLFNSELQFTRYSVYCQKLLKRKERKNVPVYIKLRLVTSDLGCQCRSRAVCLTYHPKPCMIGRYKQPYFLMADFLPTPCIIFLN